MSKGDTFLDLAEVMRRTRRSRASVYRAMNAGALPRPRKRGKQSVWVESEVQAAIANEIAALPKMGESMGPAVPAKKKPLFSVA